jgi:hypothetical protein
VSEDGVPVIRGRIYPHLGVSHGHCGARRRSTQDTRPYFWDHITSSYLHTGTARPPLTLLFSPTKVVPSKKLRSGRHECLPRDGNGGKVLKRNSTYKVMMICFDLYFGKKQKNF